MATKFLNDTGLAYFWTKIKAYVSGLGYMLKTATNNVTVKEFLFRDVDNDALRIGGGSAHAKGGNILLYGKDHATHSGRVDFQAYDGTNYSTLKFEPTDTRPTFYWLNSNNSGTRQIAYLTDIPDLSKTVSGNGNAVTDVSISGYVINITKGSTFLTSASTLDATKLSGTIPSGCYTNTTYTAGTGLSLSGTQFSLASHNQASDTINAMTGYSKPSTGSAIAVGDTLNSAIGKLEAKIDAIDDSNYVHLTGDEVVSGVKTLNGSIKFGSGSNDYGIYREDDNGYLRLASGNGADSSHGAKVAVAGSGFTTGSSLVAGSFRIFTGDNTSNPPTYYSLYGKPDGTLTWDGKDITGDVHSTGVETIGGSKTFTARPTFNNGITLGSSEIYRDVNNSSVVLSAGTSAAYTNGAKLTMYGATYSSSGDTTYRGAFRLMTGTADHHYDLVGLKGGGLTWNGQTVQTSSDERIKTKLRDVDDGVLSAWDGVEWGEFKYLDAVAEKGEASARLHVGLIAQQVIRAFAAKGLDACRYGICCHDESADAETGGRNDLWMVRYAEALCMEAAYMRRENARLKKRVSNLEERLAALELRLGSE